MKRYWKWRFHFEGYGTVEKGYFDNYGNGYDRNYWDIFQVPWDWVSKERVDEDYKEKDIEEEKG